MGNMTEIDLIALQSFAKALENFKYSVDTHCKNLEGGIVGCQRFMKDANSEKVLREAEQVCMDIRACLNPTEMLLERVRQAIYLMNSSPEM